MKGVMAAFKLATPAIAYVASGFPAAVLVYWVTHNSFSVLQALIMKIPAFKQWADIPDPPVKSATDKSEGVGFMQAFRDTRDAFSDLKDNAVEKTDKEHMEKQQIKAEEKLAETRAARKKATLDQLKAGGSSTVSTSALAEEADIAGVPVDEKQARLAAARKRRESLRSKRSRI
jgi:YidC/Oxa1 family membrane protein insertase